MPEPTTEDEVREKLLAVIASNAAEATPTGKLKTSPEGVLQLAQAFALVKEGATAAPFAFTA